VTVPSPKYAIGDTVWHPQASSGHVFVMCPDCLSKRTWHAVMPSGEELDFACPTCAHAYESRGVISEWKVTGCVQELTIGSVRINTADDDPIEYMCVETGIGSGSIWAERKLHATREAAEAELPALIKAMEIHLVESNATARKRRIADGPGRMAAYYRAQIRDAEKTIEKARRGLEREAASRAALAAASDGERARTQEDNGDE
jgi:hypothetical protein